MASIKGNVTLNIINTVVGLIFPLITFPYVSRIILPEGIGLIQFYQSIINYIILFSALGIPLYACREIASNRDDVALRNKLTLEILTLHALLSTIGYIIVIILILSVNKIHSDWPLFLLLSVSIFLNVIGVPWFYQAVEDFKFITIRSLAIRCVSLICLFIFVRSKADLYAYAVILIGGQVGNYVFNFLRLRKYNIVSIRKRGPLKLKYHLKASLKIFILNVAISLYVNINPVMLGFMSEDVNVGYYTAVTRIITAINGLTTAMGMALLPRLSNYYANNKMNEFHILKDKALNTVCIMSIPISIGLIAVSSNLIPVFSGSAYLPAILTLRISAPTLFISALNYILAIQILYTQNKEKIVIIATTIGGIVNIGLNAILIPHFEQNGVAISGLLAEFIVLIICYGTGSRYINYRLFNKNNLQVLSAAIISTGTCWFFSNMHISNFFILPIQISSAIVIYVGLLCLYKNEICLEYIALLKQFVIQFSKNHS